MLITGAMNFGPVHTLGSVNWLTVKSLVLSLVANVIIRTALAIDLHACCHVAVDRCAACEQSCIFWHFP